MSLFLSPVGSPVIDTPVQLIMRHFHLDSPAHSKDNTASPCLTTYLVNDCPDLRTSSPARGVPFLSLCLVPTVVLYSLQEASSVTQELFRSVVLHATYREIHALWHHDIPQDPQRHPPFSSSLISHLPNDLVVGTELGH